MKRILLATRSAHKAAEIQRILQRHDIELVTLAQLGLEELPEEDELEDAPTFVGNAIAKARYFAERSGLPTLADDSGLEVAALDNGPGVRTRRFALDHGRTNLSGEALDRANNELLLEMLRDRTDRAARYVCCAAFVNDETVMSAIGTTSGQIAHAPKGSGGFGYDPIFAIPELGVTFGELTPSQKDDRSHRARAFRALSAIL